MTSPSLPPWEYQATYVLRLAAAGYWLPAARLLQALFATHPQVGGRAMLLWIDLALGGAGADLHTPSPQPVRLQFRTAGRTADIDDVPPVTRWAGRLLVARLGDDAAMFSALIAALPPDPEIAGDHVLEVLRICAAIVADPAGHLLPADETSA